MPRPAPLLRWLVAVLTGLLTACGDDPAERRVRVVLITLDTLRADRLLDDPPTLQRLAAAAAEGTLFRNAWAATSCTQPTHASLFTGLHPWQHGVVRNSMELDPELPTIPELLAEAGFENRAVVASFPMSGQFGWDRGFTSYIEDFTHGRAEKKNFADHEPDWGAFYAQADTVTDHALAQLDAALGERQFLFVHYYDPHSPYGDTFRPPADSERTLEDVLVETRDLTLIAKRHNEALPATLLKAQRSYDRDVVFLDEQLGRLLDRLAADAERLDLPTHVIITADHGESFGDDKSFGHGDRVTAPQLHVPLVVLSSRMERGVRDDPVGSVDVAATLLSLAGLPADATGHGRDLTRPVPERPTPPMGMRRAYAEPAFDVRVSGRKVELWGERFWVLRDGRIVYGNSDEVGTHDGAVGESEAAEMRKLFEIFSAKLATRDNVEHMDAETAAQLEAMGYTR